MSGSNSDWLGVGEDVGCGPGSCSSLGSRAPVQGREGKGPKCKNKFCKHVMVVQGPRVSTLFYYNKLFTVTCSSRSLCFIQQLIGYSMMPLFLFCGSNLSHDLVSIKPVPHSLYCSQFELSSSSYHLYSKRQWSPEGRAWLCHSPGFTSYIPTYCPCIPEQTTLLLSVLVSSS